MFSESVCVLYYESYESAVYTIHLISFENECTCSLYQTNLCIKTLCVHQFFRNISETTFILAVHIFVDL